MRWQTLFVVSAFALVLLGCRGGPVSDTQLVGNRIVVTLWASKSCLDYGETVTLRATATNQGSLPFAIELTDRPVFDIVVGYPEEARWSDGKPLTLDLTRLELKPGESKTIEMQWVATISSPVFAPFISRSRYMDNPPGPSLSLYVGNCPGWGLQRWLMWALKPPQKNMDMSVASPPDRPRPVVKIWTIRPGMPPVSSATIAPQVQLVRCNPPGTICDYTAAVTIANFDSDQVQFVAMGVTKPQTSSSGMIWHYRADVLPPL